MFNLFKKKQSKEQIFWNWVQKNISKIEAISYGTDPLYSEANMRLKEYDEELVFEVCGNQITISANGNLDHFDAVIDLCAAAPKTERFKVNGFRQPMGFVSLVYNGVKVQHEDVYFRYITRNGKIDLEVFHSDYSEKNHNDIAGAVFIILDHGIGEYDVEKKIGIVSFDILEDRGGLKPIQELKPIIDSV